MRISWDQFAARPSRVPRSFQRSLVNWAWTREAALARLLTGVENGRVGDGLFLRRAPTPEVPPRGGGAHHGEEAIFFVTRRPFPGT